MRPPPRRCCSISATRPCLRRPSTPTGKPAGAAPLGPLDAGASPDERFADRITASATVARATRLANTALIAPQGTIILAVLETALNSDLPGFRAIVSSDVRGYDGTTVLGSPGAPS